MEPKPVIALNNLEARLDAAESEEEERVLARLSEVVAANAASILQVCKCSISALVLQSTVGTPGSSHRDSGASSES